MADLWVVVGFLAFFGTITGLLAMTFLAFTRMDKDVRRARMFIMEKRIQRFLGAFTFAFIALTVLICHRPPRGGRNRAVGRLVGRHGVRDLRTVPDRSAAERHATPYREEVEYRPLGAPREGRDPGPVREGTGCSEVSRDGRPPSPISRTKASKDNSGKSWAISVGRRPASAAP